MKDKHGHLVISCFSNLSPRVTTASLVFIEIPCPKLQFSETVVCFYTLEDFTNLDKILGRIAHALHI